MLFTPKLLTRRNCAIKNIIDLTSSWACGYRCACGPGFVLNNDGLTCADVNECNDASLCEHTCVNEPGEPEAPNRCLHESAGVAMSQQLI